MPLPEPASGMENMPTVFDLDQSFSAGRSWQRGGQAFGLSRRLQNIWQPWTLSMKNQQPPAACSPTVKLEHPCTQLRVRDCSMPRFMWPHPKPLACINRDSTSSAGEGPRLFSRASWRESETKQHLVSKEEGGSVWWGPRHSVSLASAKYPASQARSCDISLPSSLPSLPTGVCGLTGRASQGCSRSLHPPQLLPLVRPCPLTRTGTAASVSLPPLCPRFCPFSTAA